MTARSVPVDCSLPGDGGYQEGVPSQHQHEQSVPDAHSVLCPSPKESSAALYIFIRPIGVPIVAGGRGHL